MRVSPFVVMLALALGCGGDSGTNPPPPPPPGTVRATTSLQFTPSQVEINAGETVTWQFESTTHTVTFDTPKPPGTPEDIGNTRDASVQRQFTQAGTFTYFCSIHPFMKGTVIVH